MGQIAELVKRQAHVHIFRDSLRNASGYGLGSMYAGHFECGCGTVIDGLFLSQEERTAFGRLLGI